MKYIFQVIAMIWVLSAHSQQLILSSGSDFSYMPNEVIGPNIIDIFEAGDTAIAFRTTGKITYLSGNIISVESLPQEFRIDDYAIEPTTGVHFFSNSGDIYTIDIKSNVVNKFLNTDATILQVKPLDGRLVYYNQGGNILNVMSYGNPCIVESYKLNGPICCINKLEDDIIASVGKKIFVLGNKEIIPVGEVANNINSLAPTELDWIAFSTDENIGLLNPYGKCKLISDFGARKLLTFQNNLYILLNNGRVGVIKNLSSLLEFADKH